MVRAPFFDRNGIKKGAWSEEEDNKLRSYIFRYGHWNWRLLPKYAGLARCGKSCRLRWVNYLKPGVKKGNFTKQEEDLIVELHAQLGQRWSAIAAKLPRRTDNDIKNFWHSRIQKRPRQKNTAAKIITNPSIITELASSDDHSDDQVASCYETGHESASSNIASSTLSFDDSTDDLWADIFQLADSTTDYYTQNDYFPPLPADEEKFSYSELLYYSELSSGYVSESSCIPLEEAGGVYDRFMYNDYGMNLFN